MLPSGAKAPLIFLDLDVRAKARTLQNLSGEAILMDWLKPDLDVRAKARTLQNLSGEAILMDWLKPVPFKTCLVKRS
jgi:plasmid replication initiation protein